MPTITWLRKRGVKARYLENTKSDKAKDKAIERWTKEGRLPPASYPVGPRAPMWAQELLDHWDFLDENERQIVLDTWSLMRDPLHLNRCHSPSCYVDRGRPITTSCMTRQWRTMFPADTTNCLSGVSIS
jgi:hypothetical protein